MKVKVQIDECNERNWGRIWDVLSNKENVDDLTYSKEDMTARIELNVCLSGVLNAICDADDGIMCISVDKMLGLVQSFEEQEDSHNDTVLGVLDTICTAKWRNISEVIGAISLVWFRLERGSSATFTRKFFDALQKESSEEFPS